MEMELRKARLTSEEKTVVDKISCLSKLNKQEIKSIFEALSRIVTLDALEQKPTCIPFVGKLSVNAETSMADMEASAFLQAVLEQVGVEAATGHEEILLSKIRESINSYLGISD